MRREAWLILALSGIISILPIGWASFVLLLFIPGFSVASLFKEKFTLAEIVAIPLALSIVLIPVSAVVTSPLPYHLAPLALCLLTVIIGFYNYWKNRPLTVQVSDTKPMGIAVVIFLIVLLVSLKTFHIEDGELFYTFTQGLDQTFHLSIAQRYIAMPAIPPQDPYFLGAGVPYDWSMHVMLGETCRITGLALFDVFKVAVASASALIFLGAYLLARPIFSKEMVAITASLLYVLSSGLSWAYIIFTGTAAIDVTTFNSLVYQWPGITLLKYDPTSLYFFLPQPQTFGLLVAIFSLYLFLISIREKSVMASVIAGITMASLVFYHLITAFPVLLTILAMSLYLAIKEKNASTLVRLSIPIALSGIAVLIEYTLFPENAGSQLSIGHHKDILVTFLVTLGPLALFAAYAIYKGWKDDGTKLLAIFAAVNAIALNILILPATNNTYRFLTYLSLPVALFAGSVLYGWLSSESALRKAGAIAIILIMVPSTFMVAGYYVYAPKNSLASPMDVRAVEWIKDNTPVNAIVYENPDHFPRVPIISGRNILYAAQTYVSQYHGADWLGPMESILKIDDPQTVYDTLAQYNVNYVLMGGKEQTGSMAIVLSNTTYFKNVYTEGNFKIYEVVGVPVKG
ncbi:conserved hypothetical protein [Methanocella paludicola SANAE]|uniref:Glycosyltransferase RgtA/B/C/D-like domain-containing protein n=1 Tax=Methanocella paludicola (strain DSM 17711 / JCM 13418 / NBRC 101707 / SANAE) TaxID=304371 RepID=D1Z067_METPS|nr:hypothetical protein [Methanocella paludicola]BAI62089.1 conserved hypothetical protein [Methanocella paludicola SANAE]